MQRTGVLKNKGWWTRGANRGGEGRTVRRITSTMLVRAAESVRQLVFPALAEQMRSVETDGEHCPKFRSAKLRAEQVAQPRRCEA
jgi:hypothetical protein